MQRQPQQVLWALETQLQLPASLWALQLRLLASLWALQLPAVGQAMPGGLVGSSRQTRFVCILAWSCFAFF